jgi:tRNA threonylcarbamoyladenosine biosynthesis protein TsaB
MYLLGIDTCGPMGSVALGRFDGASMVEVLAQKDIEGRNYSEMLVGAVGQLLTEQGIGIRDLGGVVVVNGPGSFTGVRIGVSAAKGLAEGIGIPVIAVSRLEALARKAGVALAALDAHRREVFLRVGEGEGGGVKEMVAGVAELAALLGDLCIGVCDDAAVALLREVRCDAVLVRVNAPTAADALKSAVREIAAGEFRDIGLLDGHYLRRSDAEIFGKAVSGAVKPA